MIEFTDQIANIVEILLILGGFIAIYWRDKNKNDIDNVSQAKDIENIRSACSTCKEDNSKQFNQFEVRISKIEEKQASDSKRIYDKLDQMEERLSKQIDYKMQNTIDLITKFFKK